MQTTLEQLDEEIASFGAQMNVVTHRLLMRIREFDEREGWGVQGYQSCAHYLSYRISLSKNAAREHVRVAHALKALPTIDEAMASGALSYSKARALTRIATPQTEEDLLAMANDVSAAAVERIVRGYRRADSPDAAMKREESRSMSYYVDDDGMVVVQARLLPEEGALVIKAIEAARPEKGKRQVDMFVEMAARSLGDAEMSSVDRHQVVVHVDAETLATDDGRSEVEGVGVSAETCRRLCCDASVIAMAHDKDGNIVSTGRKSRTISTPLRRKLKERDGNKCRFPGCENRYVDGHHVQHWSKGGETTLENLVSLCRLHHRYVHEMGFSVDHDLSFRDRNGRVIPASPLPLSSQSALPVPTAEPPMPRYSTVVDYGYVIDSLLHAPGAFRSRNE